MHTPAAGQLDPCSLIFPYPVSAKLLLSEIDKSDQQRGRVGTLDSVGRNSKLCMDSPRITTDGFCST